MNGLQKAMTNKPWQEELLWVQRNELGVIVGVREHPPQTGEMIPTAPRETKTTPTGLGAGEGQ